MVVFSWTKTHLEDALHRDRLASATLAGIASGRHGGDTEVKAQGACNGRHRAIGITDESTSGCPSTLGVVTGGPHAAWLGSIPGNPLQHNSLRMRSEQSHTHVEGVFLKRAVGAGAIACPASDRRRCARSDIGRPQARRHHDGNQTLSATRDQRAAVASTVRMDDTPFCMRKVRVGRMKKRQYDYRPGCRDHNSRLLFPQNSNRYLPFLFLDARVELGRLATEC